MQAAVCNPGQQQEGAESGKLQPAVRTIHVAVGPASPTVADAAVAAPAEQQGGASDDELQQAARAAAEAAEAAVSDDEQELDDPQDPRVMGEAHFLAATELMRQKGQPKAAIVLYDKAIAAQPDQADRYHGRAVVSMDIAREKEAVQDFTVALELPGCPQQLRFQCLMFRGKCKMDVGDLAGADTDFKDAHAAAVDDRHRKIAKDHRGFLVMERVRQRKEAERRKRERGPRVQHKYGTAVIEELDPEEGSPEQAEQVARQLVQAWQEAGLKMAAEAQGRAARIAREFEAEKARTAEENAARRDRNNVRAARRRTAAAEAAAAARKRAQQATRQVVVKEHVAIPIRIEDNSAEQAEQAESSGASTRSASTQLSGYVSESESSRADTAAGENGAASAAAAVPAAASGAAEASGPDIATPPAVEPESPEPAAETPAATLAVGALAPPKGKQDAAQSDAAAVAAAAAAAAAAEEEEEQDEEEEAGEAKEAADDGAGSEAAATAPALLSHAELDSLKMEADRMQRDGKAEEADKLYARYLRQRPTDQRVLSNRAENCCKAQRWQDALDCCNEALAIASPSFAVAHHKVLFKRGAAYRGMGRLQEALRDFEAADAAAEAAEEWAAKKQIARHTAQLLAEMEAKGIQPAPSDPAALGLQASAAAAQVPLPSLPVGYTREPSVVPEEADLEGRAGAGTGAAAGSAPGACAAAGMRAKGGGGDSAGGGAPASGVGAVGEGASGQGAALTPGEILTAASRRAAAKAEEAAAAKRESEAERAKGNEFFKKRQWEVALRRYERAAELDPGCKLALANQAAALLKLKRFNDAADRASQALAIDSSFYKARFRRAHAYFQLGNVVAALLDMKIAAESEPGDRQAQRDLRMMQDAYDKEQAAIGTFDTYSNNPLFSPPKTPGQ